MRNKKACSPGKAEYTELVIIYENTNRSEKTSSKCHSSLQIDWRDLHVTGKRGKEQVLILNNVTGSTKPGELMAIMGSSGAGKSTLMNVLTRRNTKGLKISGRVSINGMEVKEDISKLRHRYF